MFYHDDPSRPGRLESDLAWFVESEFDELLEFDYFPEDNDSPDFDLLAVY